MPRHILSPKLLDAATEEGYLGETDMLPPYRGGRCLRNQELYILTVDRQ